MYSRGNTPVEPMTIYTISYEGRSLEQFLADLRAAGIRLLADVREAPFSRKPGFSKNVLAAALREVDIGYRHLRPLGCPRPIRDQYRKDGEWERYTRGFMAHLQEQQAAIAELAGWQARNLLRCFAMRRTSIVAIAPTSREPWRSSLERGFDTSRLPAWCWMRRTLRRWNNSGSSRDPTRYVIQARGFFDRVAGWRARTHLSPTCVRFRHMKRFWAVCNVDNSITFAVALLDQPEEFQDLVIVHELVHLLIRDHGRTSRRFLESSCRNTSSLVWHRNRLRIGFKGGVRDSRGASAQALGVDRYRAPARFRDELTSYSAHD